MGALDVDAIASRLNPAVVAILRTPLLHWILSPGLMLLGVTGRRSGRYYTIPVGYQRKGDALIVLVSQARRKQWWRNYREAGPVQTRLRGRSRSGNAVAIAPDSEEFGRRIEESLRRVPAMARVFGVASFDRLAGLTAEQHEFLAREVAIVRIELSAV
jgi:deazaflavin-dependent oxidoreductase (nitroreductase family)